VQKGLDLRRLTRFRRSTGVGSRGERVMALHWSCWKWWTSDPRRHIVECFRALQRSRRYLY